MNGPQSGIFALGNPSHAYLEFDLQQDRDSSELVTACRRARAPHDDRRRQPRVGIQTELWRALAPNGLPDDLVGFDDDLVGADDFVMPAAQHDAVLWLSGGSYDVIFDEARQAIKALAQIATVADETSSWPYQRYRDLTGFEDGRQITLTQ